MKCQHYKGDGYGYTLDDKTELNLCEACNANLAASVMYQLALEVFIKPLKG